MKKVLISAPYMIPEVERFRNIFEENGIEIIIAEVKERLCEDELLQYTKEIDGVICGDDKFTGKVISSSPRLKVISKWGTGIDSIDVSECEKHGIKIFRTTNAFSEPVADTVWGSILCFARQIIWMDREIKGLKWKKLTLRALNECVLGIVGVGDCGKAVARRAKAFGTRLMGNDIKQIPEKFIEETGISMVSPKQLLEESDYISINTDLNPSSYHLMAKEQFSAMKRTAVLINTSRGDVVDEKALIEALDKGLIYGAALDVFEEEPIRPDNPLLKMSNVILSPHNANSSPVAREKVHVNTINNLIKNLKEEES